MFSVKFAKEQSWIQDESISKVERVEVISKGLGHWREAAGDLKPDIETKETGGSPRSLLRLRLYFSGKLGTWLEQVELVYLCTVTSGPPCRGTEWMQSWAENASCR